ncbi:MAG: OmpA family protein [Pseudohongiellaceae bacterium]
MKRLFRQLNAGSVVLAAGLLGFASQGAADEGRFYIAPGAQWMDFGGVRESGDDVGPAVGLGYGLSDRLSIEFNAARLKPDYLIRPGEDNIRHLRLDLLYGLEDSEPGRISPFVVTGIGDNEFRLNKDDTVVNFGGGFRYRLTDQIEWRAAARTFLGLDESTADFGVDTALVIHMGERRRTERVPPTPAPEQEPEQQARMADSDGDGVPDDRDRCPDTPSAHAVDEDGCSIMVEEVAEIELQVQFDFDSDEVKSQYYDDIGRVADFLDEYEDTVAELSGHTDSIGPEEYNQNLSERRANAVRDALIEEFDVQSGRVTAVGYGESEPVASNDTREGREQNRRVMSVLSTTVQRAQLEDE